jgi:hypothetical protein
MQSSPTLRSERNAFLPWFVVALLTLSMGLYIFREPLAGLFFHIDTKPGLSTGGVLQSIRDLNNLESVAMYYQVPVRETRDGNPFLLGLDGQQALIIAEGAVTAGVDLGLLGEDNVRVLEDGKRIEITLPPAELLSVNVTKMQTEDIETGLFNLLPPDETLHDTALISAQAKMRDLACASGIMEIAQTNAERSVQSLFTLIDGVEVFIESSSVGTCE